jgi:glucokinase
MAHAYVIAVDLGGTNLRVGAVREDGSVEEKEKYDSEARSGSKAVLGRVAQAVKRIAGKIELRKGDVRGVALGFPGIVDGTKGIVYQSPHFPDWKHLDLLTYFKKELPWPIVVDNDANMAARGEGWKGAGQGLKNFVMLTFGTGLGGGIMAEGEILHGDRGFAGEIGHLGIEPEGHRCACGSRGCLEMYVSAQGILKSVETTDDPAGRDRLLARIGKSLEKLTVQDLHEAALDGDIFANITFKKMGRYLGIGIASLTNTLGIETFLIGGGIAQAWDFFIEAAKKELADRTYREIANRVQIKKAMLGDNAGLIGGGAALFKRSLPD